MRAGRVSPVEMARTFNCGVGMVIIVGRENTELAMESLRDNGELEVFVMGEVVDKIGVEYTEMERWEL